MNVVDHLFEVRTDDLAPDIGIEHHILLRAPVIRDMYHINPEVDAFVGKLHRPFRLTAVELVELVGIKNEPHKLIFDTKRAVEILKEARCLNVAEASARLMVLEGCLESCVGRVTSGIGEDILGEQNIGRQLVVSAESRSMSFLSHGRGPPKICAASNSYLSSNAATEPHFSFISFVRLA